MRFTVALPVLFLALPSSGAEPTTSSLQFVLDAVAERGFLGCDAAVRDVFLHVEGDDVRVNTDWMVETRADSLGVTAIFGKTGDAVFITAEFRRVGRTCAAKETVVLNSSTSCTALLAERQSWKLIADTVGVLSAKNPGGVNLTLMPTTHGGCTRVFQRSITR